MPTDTTDSSLTADEFRRELHISKTTWNRLRSSGRSSHFNLDHFPQIRQPGGSTLANGWMRAHRGPVKKRREAAMNCPRCGKPMRQEAYHQNHKGQSVHVTHQWFCCTNFDRQIRMPDISSSASPWQSLSPERVTPQL